MRVIPKSPKGWLKTFCVAFHIFVAQVFVDKLVDKFGMWVSAYGRQTVPERVVVTIT